PRRGQRSLRECDLQAERQPLQLWSLSRSRGHCAIWSTLAITECESAENRRHEHLSIGRGRTHGAHLGRQGGHNHLAYGVREWISRRRSPSGKTATPSVLNQSTLRADHQNRITIYGPKDDGTFLVEFRTADGRVHRAMLESGA